MNNNVICRAKFKANANKVICIIGIAIFVIIVLATCRINIDTPDSKGSYDNSIKVFGILLFENVYDANYEVGEGMRDWDGYIHNGEWYMRTYNLPSALAVGLISIIITFSPLVITCISKYIANRCSLELRDKQIKGQAKTLFGKKALQMPLEHVDNVVVSHNVIDKFVGGKTLLIRSNNGVVKFHYVQNADEFARVAMEKIEEVKKKTFHNPASAPTASPAQPTGNDTMEKLDSLKKMLENGLITQEEFDAKRKELLEKL